MSYRLTWIFSSLRVWFADTMRAFSPRSFRCRVLLLMPPNLVLLVPGEAASSGVLPSLSLRRLAPSSDWKKINKYQKQDWICEYKSYNGPLRICGLANMNSHVWSIVEYWFAKQTQRCFVYLAEVWIFLTNYLRLLFLLLLCLRAAGVQLRNSFFHHLFQNAKSSVTSMAARQEWR